MADVFDGNRFDRRKLLVQGTSYLALIAAAPQSIAQPSAWFEILLSIVKALGQNAGSIFEYFSEKSDKRSQLCDMPVEVLADLETRLFRLAVSMNSYEGEPFGETGDSGIIRSIRDYMDNPSKKNWLSLREAEAKFLESSYLYINEVVTSSRWYRFKGVKSQVGTFSYSVQEAEALKVSLENIRHLLRGMRTGTERPDKTDLMRIIDPMRQTEARVRSTLGFISRLVQERISAECAPK